MNEDIKIILESMAIQIRNLEKEIDERDNKVVNSYQSLDAIKFDFNMLASRFNIDERV